MTGVQTIARAHRLLENVSVELALCAFAGTAEASPLSTSERTAALVILLAEVGDLLEDVCR